VTGARKKKPEQVCSVDVVRAHGTLLTAVGKQVRAKRKSQGGKQKSETVTAVKFDVAGDGDSSGGGPVSVVSEKGEGPPRSSRSLKIKEGVPKRDQEKRKRKERTGEKRIYLQLRALRSGKNDPMFSGGRLRKWY